MDKNWKDIRGPITVYGDFGKVKVATFATFMDFIRSREYYYNRSQYVDYIPSYKSYRIFDYKVECYNGHINLSVKCWYGGWMHNSKNRHHIIAKDECNMIIPLWRMKEAFMNDHETFFEKTASKTGYYGYYKPDYHDNGKHYRNGPVPNIRKRRNWSYHRHMKTTNERRIAMAHEMDEEIKKYGIKIRDKRKSANITNAWDDVRRSDYDVRSWKKHRKTQYKVNS